MRRYLKKHQVPFTGFAWNHLLRARWRELGNLDPIVSQHTGWLEFLRENIFFFLLLNGAMGVAYTIGIGIPVVLGHFRYNIWVILFLVGFLGVITNASALLTLLNPWNERRNAAGIFLAAMKELAEAIQKPLEQLLNMEESELRCYAKEALKQDAENHRLRERLYRNPDAPEREETRATFRKHFNLFKKFGLIAPDATWDPYF